MHPNKFLNRNFLFRFLLFIVAILAWHYATPVHAGVVLLAVAPVAMSEDDIAEFKSITLPKL